MSWDEQLLSLKEAGVDIRGVEEPVFEWPDLYADEWALVVFCFAGSVFMVCRWF